MTSRPIDEPDSRTRRLLDSIAAGDEKAAAELFGYLHDELRERAVALFSQERPGHLLQPSALVNDAFFRLGRLTNITDLDRDYFLAIAARAMRQVLVDYARRIPVEQLSTTGIGGLAGECMDERRFLTLHVALEKLAIALPVAARVVELRYFAGMTVGQAARVLDLAPRRIDEHWSYARAWLRDELGRN